MLSWKISVIYTHSQNRLSFCWLLAQIKRKVVDIVGARIKALSMELNQKERTVETVLIYENDCLLTHHSN